MAVISPQAFARAMLPYVTKWYGMEFDEWETEYTQIFDVEKSTRAYEEETGVVGFGLASEKPVGQSITYDTTEQGFTQRYTNVTYGIGFIITRELFEDDQYKLFGKQKAVGLAFSVKTTIEVLCANVLNRAFNSDYTGADGLELCSLLHVNKSGGTWQNELTTAADLSEYALEQVCIDMSAWTTDRGLPYKVLPKKLIIHPSNQFEAVRILKSQLQNDTANNATNALRTMGIIPEIVFNHNLTDSDAWFIKTSAKDGLKYKERRKPEFGMDSDFDTENAKYKATFRGKPGWTDPKGIFGSSGK